MSKGLAILLTGVLALFIGFWIGRAVVPAPPPPGACSNKGNHTITVGTDGSILHGDDCVAIKKHNLLTWVCDDPKRMLTIEFEEQIFDDMTPGHVENGKQLYVVDCKNRHCFSRGVKSGAATEVKHKYWQFVSDDSGGGNPKKVDGWIVIDRGN